MIKDKIVDNICIHIEDENDINKIKQEYIEYRKKIESQKFDVLQERIQKFRLNREEE